MPEATNGAYAGHQACEYLQIGGSYATPTWVRIKRIEDVDMPDERGTSQFKIKGSDFERTIRGVRAKGVAFKYRKKRAADPVFAELKAAYEGHDLAVEYAATDRPIATVGAEGFRGPFTVTKFNETRPFEGVVEVDIELKFADADHPVETGEPWEIEPILVEAE